MTLEMSGLCMNKDKRNFIKALYSKLTKLFSTGVQVINSEITLLVL